MQLVRRLHVADRERAAGAVQIVGAALLVLGAAEIREHVVVRPAGIAELPPMVEILFLAADIDETVDRRRAAQHLAARPLHAPPAQRLERLGLVDPGDRRVEDVAVEPGGDVNPGIGVLAAGFEQQHLRAGIGGQAIGQDAPRRTRADDDEIGFKRSNCIRTCFKRHFLLAYRSSGRGSMKLRHPILVLNAAWTVACASVATAETALQILRLCNARSVPSQRRSAALRGWFTAAPTTVRSPSFQRLEAPLSRST